MKRLIETLALCAMMCFSVGAMAQNVATDTAKSATKSQMERPLPPRRPMVDQEPMKAPVATNEEKSIMVQYLKGLSFDADKMKVAKLLVQVCRLDVDGLRLMANTMSWDDSKMEFLKFARQYVVDPMNYSELVDVFEFSSNIKKFYKFIDGE